MPTSITLKEPIQAHGETITTLEIRNPKGKDFKKISGAAMEAPFKMILDFAAILADVPPSALDELGVEDVEAVCAVVGPFLGKSPATGGM
jgi:hypothetical protein